MYAVNLADDLESWLARGKITRDLVTRLGDELRQVAEQLVTGASVQQVSEIEVSAEADIDDNFVDEFIVRSPDDDEPDDIPF